METMTGQRLPTPPARRMISVMDPRYPVGKFELDKDATPETRRTCIAQLDALPRDVAQALAQLPPQGLDTPYRAGGWTARQVVHHLADSHMNAYSRIKLALSEEAPALKTYPEEVWAEMPDARTADPAVSMSILEGVHRRLTLQLEALSPEQFARTATHPQWGTITVDFLVQVYAWHCRHHVAHIKQVRVGG